MRCVQPGSRRVAGADGTNGPATSAGAGVCPVQNRPSRRATAEDPELALPHWHTPPPLQRTAGARREGGRLRVAVVDSATPPGRPTAAATAQVAVEHGARRRAPSKPPPLPAAQHVSSRADSPTGQEACRSCAAPSCGQCGTSTSYVYLERRGGESARARVGHTTPRTRPRHAAHRLSAFQVPHVLAPLAYFDNVCDPPLLPGTSVIAPRLCAHCALSTVPDRCTLPAPRARVSSGCAVYEWLCPAPPPPHTPKQWCGCLPRS